ncbi:Uncharacterized protein Rs2_35750 [Raphanus sativus]|nr:Uncharacterized protein Rs2_35750 [Raphanus sativus]
MMNNTTTTEFERTNSFNYQLQPWLHHLDSFRHVRSATVLGYLSLKTPCSNVSSISQCRGEPVPQELQDRLWESSKRCFCWWRSFRIRSTEGITLSNGSSRRQYLDGANIIPKLNCSSPLTFLRRPLKLLRKKWNLWMIGARPVADGRGIVNRVEPVILEELGRRGLML